MENLMMILVALAAMGCLGSQLLAAAVLLRRWERPDLRESETPEEAAARQTAAEAQRLYEQGFVNLMRYDGRPPRSREEAGQ